MRSDDFPLKYSKQKDIMVFLQRVVHPPDVPRGRPML